MNWTLVYTSQAKRDAKKLAMFGAQGMLREVTVPSLEREAARDVLRLREQVVEEGRRLGRALVEEVVRERAARHRMPELSAQLPRERDARHG